MNITALLTGYYNKSGELNRDENLFVANAIAHIIHNYILTAVPSFVLTLSCKNRQTCNYFGDLLGTLFPLWGTPMLQFVVLRDGFRKPIKGRRFYNLIMTDSYQSFLEINVMAHTARYDYNEFYHILLHGQGTLLNTEMQHIFDYCWQHQLINCNIQVQNARGEVLIYSYFPYTAQHCGKVVPVLVNQFNGTALLVNELFQRKLRNFYGCALNAAIWHDPPFVKVDTYANGSSRLVGGFEGNLLQTLADKLNFSINIRKAPNNEQRRSALGMLNRRYADLSLGCFRQTAVRTKNATPVVSYYQSTQSASVLTKAYDFTSLEILLYPFATETWFFILTVTALSFATLALINRYYQQCPQLFPRHSTSHSYLNILLILVGMPVTTTPLRHFARLVCTSWLLFTMLLRAVYQALLFHLIRTHVTNPIPTHFDVLLAENYTAVMNIATYETLLDVPFLQQLRQISVNTTLQWVAFEYIEQLPLRGIIAVAPLDFLYYYCRRNHKVGVFKLLPQDIINLQLTMYLTKHSFLVDQFEEEIIWIRSAGLIGAWNNWELDQEYLRRGHQDTDKVLSLNDLYMAFGVGCFGLSCALLTFLFESLSKRVRILRRLFL